MITVEMITLITENKRNEHGSEINEIENEHSESEKEDNGIGKERNVIEIEEVAGFVHQEAAGNLREYKYQVFLIPSIEQSR